MISDIYYTYHPETGEEKFIGEKEKFIEYINAYIQDEKKKVKTIKQAEKYFQNNFTKDGLDFLIRAEVIKK